MYKYEGVVENDPEGLRHDDEFTDINDLYEEEPEWIVNNFIPVGLSFISGPPKSLKSTWAIAAACEVAGCATDFHFKAANRYSPVRVFSAEATGPVLKHMIVNDLHYRLPPYGLFKVCDDVWQYRLDTKKGFKKLMLYIETHEPEFVIIDPLRNFHSGDENDSKLMFDILAPLREWAIDTHGAVLVVHHNRKPPSLRMGESMEPYSPHDMRGTGALFGIADGVLVLTPQLGEKSEPQTILNATFKRAKPYTKIVQLGVFGHAGKLVKDIM